MGQLSIVSNGRIENTTVCYNGEALGSVQELMVTLDENGTYMPVIQYIGTDHKIYNRQLFSEPLDAVNVMGPAAEFEEAGDGFHELEVESKGDIESTQVW